MIHGFLARGGWNARALASMAVLLIGCKAESHGPPPFDIETATLTARQSAPTQAAAVGKSALGLATGRDGFLYVPASYNPATPVPLLVLLHGAGQSADFWSSTSITGLADQHGFAILAVDSRNPSWDLIETMYEFGADVDFIDQALTHTFQRVNVDPLRIAIGGFSDGASYALSLGVINGDVFQTIIAFSPGRLYGPARRGNPGVYIAHGATDEVINVTYSREIVRVMRGVGYRVYYTEFTGGHTVPANISRQGIEWYLAGNPLVP